MIYENYWIFIVEKCLKTEKTHVYHSKQMIVVKRDCQDLDKT